jgi:hypothetical protein
MLRRSVARIVWGAILLLGGCCSWVVTGEGTIYRGHIVGLSDSTIKIYADNLKRGVFSKGEIRPGWKPKHPDSEGFFIIGGTTPSHDECGPDPDHWDNGPLEIFIRGPHIQDYHDTLSVAELKALIKLNADSLGIALDRYERGVWQLPDIVLTPKP